MTPEEMKKAIEQLKATGASEEEILGGFYKMFQDDKLTIDELEGITNLMGYHFSDEFKAMSPEDQKTKGYEETEEPAEGVEKEEVEEAKETEPEEKPEEKESEEKEPEKEEDDSEEEKRAMKLFDNKL